MNFPQGVPLKVNRKVCIVVSVFMLIDSFPNWQNSVQIATLQIRLIRLILIMQNSECHYCILIYMRTCFVEHTLQPHLQTYRLSIMASTPAEVWNF